MLKLLLLTALLIQSILGPPVDKKETIAEPGQNETIKDVDLGLEYNKYLQEVVQILENDPEFRKKLESAKVDEIRDGTIAKELEFLGHGVRTKLDEVKRQELERLRHMAQKQFEAKEGIDRKHFKIPKHLDVKSANFDVEDLQKLIKQTTADLVSTIFVNIFLWISLKMIFRRKQTTRERKILRSTRWRRSLKKK